MEHAGYAYVVNVNQFAGGLRRKVGARHRLADDGVGIDGFYRNIISQFQADVLAGDQFAVADAAVIASADQAVFYREVLQRHFESFGGPRDQELPRLCRRVAQGDRCYLDGLAGDGRTLIGSP